MINAEALSQLVATALEDIKAEDIRVLDVRGQTSIADFMIIASGGSDRQVRAMAQAVVEAAKKEDVLPLGQEGQQDAQWVLVDLGDVIVHAMQREPRLFYQLEKLWERLDAAPAAAD